MGRPIAAIWACKTHARRSSRKTQHCAAVWPSLERNQGLRVNCHANLLPLRNAHLYQCYLHIICISWTLQLHPAPCCMLLDHKPSGASCLLLRPAHYWPTTCPRPTADHATVSPLLNCLRRCPPAPPAHPATAPAPGPVPPAASLLPPPAPAP